MAELTAADIESGLAAIGRLAKADGRLIEISVYGGSAIVLAFDFRRTTRDVDIIVHGGDAPLLRRYAAAVAASRGWDRSWLNDAVKGFASARSAEGLRAFRSYPDEEEVGLRVMVPTPEYLLAMKCLAMRIDSADRSHDLADIFALMDHTGLTTRDALIGAVERFYPASLITPRVAFGIQQIAEEHEAKQHALPSPKKPGRGR